VKLIFVLDPLETLKINKDTSYAMMREAQARGHEVWVTMQHGLELVAGEIKIDATQINITKNDKEWFEVLQNQSLKPSDVDAIVMRKDPPFDMEYVYSTYMLELAEQAGCAVYNRPQSIRDFNEKLSITKHSEWIAPTLVSANPQSIKDFVQTHQEVVLKPLDGMGGTSIFRSRPDDPNLGVIIESLTQLGTRTIMVQRFIEEISEGDKRVLLIDGQPVPFSLARIPQGTDHRGNLAAGGRGVAMPLTEREAEIAQSLGPELAHRGLLLVGLDIIGGYLTEINVTSPTCMREIQDQTGFDVPGMFIDAIERNSGNHPTYH